MVNLYDTPAQAQFINTYVPIQFEGLYKLVAQKREDIKEGNAALDKVSKYGALGSMAVKDNANYAKKVASINEYIKENIKNPYDLSNPTVKAGLYGMIRDFESDSEIKDMIETKEALKEQSKTWDPRWGDFYTNMARNHDTSVDGIWNKRALEYPEWYEIAEKLTDKIEPRKLSTSKDGFTDEYGVLEADVRYVVEQNRSGIVSDEARKLRVKKDILDMQRAGDPRLLEYVVEHEDGSKTIDEERLMIDNVIAAALDKTIGRKYEANRVNMFKYEQNQARIRHAQSLRASEKRAEFDRISTMVIQDAQIATTDKKLASAVNAISRAITAAGSDPEKQRQLGSSVLGPISYQYYVTDMKLNETAREIKKERALMAQAQANGDLAAVKASSDKITNLSNTYNSDNNNLKMLVPGALSEINDDERLAIETGRGSVFTYDEAQNNNLYQLNTAIGTNWNAHRYGDGKDTNVTFSDGSVARVTRVLNPQNLYVTNPNTLDDRVIKPGTSVSIFGKPIPFSYVSKPYIDILNKMNGLIQSGLLNGNALMADGGSAKFDSNGNSRKLSYLYIPEVTIDNNSYVKFGEGEKASITDLPGASKQRILVTPAVGEKEAVYQIVYKIPVSTDFYNSDPNNVDRKITDAKLQGNGLYKQESSSSFGYSNSQYVEE